MNAILLAAGFLSLYFGYRLFCSFSRRSLHMISGALLAVFGMAVLIGQARGFEARRIRTGPAIHQSPNWHNGSAPSHHQRGLVELIA